MNFNIEHNQFAGLKIITPKIFNDERGYFIETYKKSDFAKMGINDDFIQSNQSLSKQGVIRGLHFQKNNFAQAKLVQCLRGEIYDVVVDLRKSSPTFGQSFGINISDKNHVMLYIPIGFAHGFATISQEAEIYYKVAGSEYHPSAESGIRYNDPALAINWKITQPIVSSKDAALPFFHDLKDFF